MATIRERLDADLKDAMRAKDELKTSVIRMAKSAIKYKEVEGTNKVLDEPGIPRHGHDLWQADTPVGTVTSGARSPTLERFIALGYVGRGSADAGTVVQVDIRGRRVPARIVERPFYRRVNQER